jgi:hypothetical protein
MVPWPGQQTVQARLRLGREGQALSRLISGAVGHRARRSLEKRRHNRLLTWRVSYYFVGVE